jgi:ribose 5-phosphate isomerase B
MDKMKDKIAIGGDHAGFELKGELIKYMESKGYRLQDFGTYSDESTDYADYIHPLCKSIEENVNTFGIAICGSANGVSMTANKHQKIRAALCWIPEIATLAREHNDANVLALPARYLSLDEAKSICDAFFNASFEGGRHKRRVDKIAVDC